MTVKMSVTGTCDLTPLQVWESLETLHLWPPQRKCMRKILDSAQCLHAVL